MRPSQNDRYFIIPFILTLCFSFYFVSSQESAKSEQGKKEPLSEWSKQWLEEVVPYIVTDAEKKIFLSLSTEEERGAFIVNFWKKRDPNPATPENEFKLEYYKRIALSNKFFGTSGLEGWRSDRGKIFILLGPPQDIQRDSYPSGSSFTSSQGPTETWNYWDLPNPRLPYNLELVFVDKFGTGNFVFDNSIKLGTERNSSFDISTLTFQFDLLEYLAEAQKNPYENLGKVKEIITTKVTYDLIPLKMELFYLRGSGNKAYIPLIIGLPSSLLTPKNIENQTYISLNLLLNVSNNLGQMIYAKSKDLNKRFPLADVPSLKEKSFQILTSLYLEPAIYHIHLLLLDNFSGKIGTFDQEISVPDFYRSELASSDVILSSNRKEDQALNTESKDLHSAEEKIFSDASHVFRPGEEMGVFFEVYNLSSNKKAEMNHFRVEYVLVKNGEDVTSIPVPETKPSNQRNVRIQTSFRLKNIKPGEYRLRIKITDLISGKWITKETAFVIADSNPP